MPNDEKRTETPADVPAQHEDSPEKTGGAAETISATTKGHQVTTGHPAKSDADKPKGEVDAGGEKDSGDQAASGETGNSSGKAGAGDAGGGAGGGAGSAVPLLLIEPTVPEFAAYTPDELKALYEQLEVDYKAIVNEFLNSANAYVGDFKKYRTKQKKWRVSMLVLTGGLALLNIVAAQEWRGGTLLFLWWPLPASQFFSLCAACYAAVLALLANIESFFNYSDAKANSRLSRELFLDAYREYRMLWYSYVRPFGYRPQACYNASILLRKIVGKDTEIRRKVKEADRETSAPAK